MMKKTTLLTLLLTVMLCMGLSACGKDETEKDEPVVPSHPLVGVWTNTNDFGDITVSNTLVFNNDYTGSIRENWTTRSSATYSMDFEWATNTDANGNTILTVSKTRGNDDVDLFPGADEGVVVWTRRYYLTGNTLNITTGEGYVMVFKR